MACAQSELAEVYQRRDGDIMRQFAWFNPDAENGTQVGSETEVMTMIDDWNEQIVSSEDKIKCDSVEDALDYMVRDFNGYPMGDWIELGTDGVNIYRLPSKETK